MIYFAQQSYQPNYNIMKKIIFILYALLISLGTTAQNTTFSVAISQSIDDGTQEGVEVELDDDDLEMGYKGSTLNMSGLIFRNIEIPNGVEIANAYIQFTSHEENNTGFYIRIRGEATDNPVDFSTINNNFTDRQPTEAAIEWYISGDWSAFTSGPDQKTPDLSAILQEIINRPGWQSGNAMCFLIDGTELSKRIEVESFDQSNVQRIAVLTVEWGYASVNEEVMPGLKIFPNPASEVLWVTIPSNFDGIYDWDIYQMDGKYVGSGKSFEGSFEINLTN